MGNKISYRCGSCGILADVDLPPEEKIEQIDCPIPYCKGKMRPVQDVEDEEAILSGLALPILRYKIGTTLASVHIIKQQLAVIDEQWNGLSSPSPKFIADHVQMAREHIDIIDSEAHSLELENR